MTAQSGAMTAQSGAMTAQSGAMIAQSGAMIAQSGAMTAQSGAMIAQSGAMTAQSGATTAQSGASCVKLVCSRRYTQMVPKWHLAGHLAGPDFFNTHLRRGAHKSLCFSPGANLGGFGLLRNGGKRALAILGQAGVFPAIYGA